LQHRHRARDRAAPRTLFVSRSSRWSQRSNPASSEPARE